MLATFTARFGVRLHAFVLMDNHYHLVVQTPRANLSPAMHWLGVSYSSWFNRRHGRTGHLFQGGFKAIMLEGPGVAAEVSGYVHLNPARVRSLGLGKAEQARSRQGLPAPPSAELIRRRLQLLRAHCWSSYGAYAGWRPAPQWLTTATLLAVVGGARPRGAWPRTYREQVEALVREGVVSRPWERLRAGVVLGGAEFVRQVRRMWAGDRREQAGWRGLESAPNFEVLVRVVEQLRGEPWAKFRDRHGDPGRDLVLWLARRHSGLSLARLGELAGGLDYVTVCTAVRRLEARATRDRQLAALCSRAEATVQQMQNEKL